MSGLFSWLGWSTKGIPHRGVWSLDRDRNEAQRLLRAGNFTEAERYLVQEIGEADLRNFSPARRIALRIELSEAQRKQALQCADDASAKPWLTTAENTARQAIAIAAQVSDGAGYVQALDLLAEIFIARKDWPAVEKVTGEALRLGARLPHPDPLQMARRVQRLGTARHWNGRPEEAVQALEKALTLHEQHYGPDHLETANLLFESGKIYCAQGDYDRAGEYLRRAFYAHRRHLGESSEQVFDDLHQWAASLEGSGDLEGAAEKYERALQICERQLGGDNLERLGEMQFSLANLYTGWGNLSRSRELLAEAIGTFRRLGGPRLAVSYEALAHVEETSGRHFGALRELEFAGKVWEKCGSSRTQELARNLQYRADLLDQLRKHREAFFLRDRAWQLSLPDDRAAAASS